MDNKYLFLIILFAFTQPGVAFGLIIGFFYFYENSNLEKSLMYDIDLLDKKSSIKKWFKENTNYTEE